MDPHGPGPARGAGACRCGSRRRPGWARACAASAARPVSRGCAWLDTGTQDSLLEASQFVEALDKRQGMKVSCIEEIAFRMGYIDILQLKKLANDISNSSYGKYLDKVINENS